MAKKLVFANNDECKKASSVLKQNNIEHVLVTYKHEKNEKVFIVVRNVTLKDVNQLNLQISRVKSMRHFEATAIKHDYFEPQFTCKCRNCGKEFKHHIKEAVWCSKECHNAFRNAKRQAKLAEQ